MTEILGHDFTRPCGASLPEPKGARQPKRPDPGQVVAAILGPRSPARSVCGQPGAIAGRFRAR